MKRYFKKKTIALAEKLKIAYGPSPKQASENRETGNAGGEMSRRLAPCWTALLAVTGLLGLVSPVAAQLGTVGGPIAQSQVMSPPSSDPPSNTLADFSTYVSFIDSALPRTQGRVLFDYADYIRQPTRAEYFQPKGGLPGSPGPPLPETNINYFQVTSYGEVAIFPTLSAFLTTPLRFLNPEENRDTWGMGDIDIGFKWAFVNFPTFVATFQGRLYIPTAANSALGTEHVSFEPAILANYHIADSLTLEGECRYWAPVGGTDFAGDVLRYGLGLSYKFPLSDSISLSPVVEGIGWTVLGGKVLEVDGSNLSIRSAETTMFNVYGGLRVGFGQTASVYAGYGRALTGTDWYREIFRLEVRFAF
jgi:hypothetical protein